MKTTTAKTIETSTTPEAAVKLAAKKAAAKKITKKAAAAKKPATKKATKKSTAKKAAPKVVVAKDLYGFRKDSTTAKAVEMLATGKHTMAEVKTKFGATFYDALNKITTRGFKVKHEEDGKYTITKK